MKKSYFMKIYRRRQTYRIMAFSLILLAITALLYFGISTYNDKKNNPIIVKTFEDYNLALENESYIQVSSDNVYDLNLVIVEKKSRFGIILSENVKSRVVAINLDLFTLPIALSDSEYNDLVEQKNGPYIFKGTLASLKDSEVNLIKDSIKSNNQLSKGLQAQPYLQYLQCKDPFTYASIFFLLAALLIILCFSLYIGFIRKNHIALKSLRKFSNGDLESACKQIDEELTLPNVYRTGPITVTKSYIIIDTQPIVFALPLSELMWIYSPSVKSKYSDTMVPTSNVLILVFSDKTQYIVNLFKQGKAVNPLLKYLRDTHPNAFIGYSQSLQTLSKKHWDDFMIKWKNNSNNEDIL